jgi:hypothetical protein
MPLVLCTTLLRLGHFMNSPDGGGNTDAVLRGMLRSVLRSGWITSRFLIHKVSMQDDWQLGSISAGINHQVFIIAITLGMIVARYPAGCGIPILSVFDPSEGMYV